MAPKRNFQSKTVVITGAASGIGLAVARRFAKAGAVLGLLDMDQKALEARAAEFIEEGIDALAVPCDVTEQEACEAAIHKIIDQFGGIDLLFNNAGITQRGAFADTHIDVFRSVMEVNFFGALYCTKAAIRSLVDRQGMIIANESIAGLAPLLGRSGYSASKHAMHGLFTSLRSEVRARGVHVMIVCPGFVKTNLQARALGPDGGVTTHPQSRIGRQGTAEEAAEAIYRGALREKDLLILTPVGKLAYWLSRLAPTFYEKSMARRLRSELAYGPAEKD